MRRKEVIDMKWLRDFVQRSQEEAEREHLVVKGKAIAFKAVADQLDPEKHCQVCGTEFYRDGMAGAHYHEHPDHNLPEPVAKA